MNLKERTIVIIQRVKSIKLNYWDLGNDLLFIYEHELFKQEGHTSMEEYVENHKMNEEFSFGYRQAQKYMTIAKELKRDEVSSGIPIGHLQLIAQVPEEQREELLKEVEDREINREQLVKRITRMKEATSSEPANSEEQGFRLIRQWETIEIHIEEGLEAISKLNKGIKDEITSWIASAEKYPLKNETLNEYLERARGKLK